MKTKTRYNIKRIVSNSFGVLGYLSCCLQWVWILVLYFDKYKETLMSFSKTENTEGYLPNFTIQLPEVVTLVVGSIIVVLVLCLTVYVIIKIPSTIVNTSKKAIRDTAEKAAPLAIKAMHKKQTKKLRLKITYELIIVIKTVLIIIPIALTYAHQFSGNQQIDYEIVKIVGCFLSAFSAVTFGIQYILSLMLSVKRDDIC